MCPRRAWSSASVKSEEKRSSAPPRPKSELYRAALIGTKPRAAALGSSSSEAASRSETGACSTTARILSRTAVGAVASSCTMSWQPVEWPTWSGLGLGLGLGFGFGFGFGLGLGLGLGLGSARGVTHHREGRSVVRGHQVGAQVGQVRHIVGERAAAVAGVRAADDRLHEGPALPVALRRELLDIAASQQAVGQAADVDDVTGVRVLGRTHERLERAGRGAVAEERALHGA
eukprot:scaffold14634_cov61-Phaeocystis_antarctica.AAC.5